MSSTSKLQKVAQKVRVVLEKVQPFTAGLATLDKRAAALNAVVLALQATLKKGASVDDDDLSIELLAEFSTAIAKVKPHMSRRGKNSILRILDRCNQLLTEEASHEQISTGSNLQNSRRR